MSEPDLPDVDEDVPGVDPETLKAELDAGEPVTMLDTRAPADHEEWRIEGDSVEHVNVPYFEFLAGEPDEETLSQVPDDRPLTAVCAKGASSEFVAAKLRQRGYDVRGLEGGMQEWARLYERVELDVETDARVFQYRRPSSGCLAYLVVDGEAAVVDPLRAFVDRYVADARELGAEVRYALDTHVHADHVSGVRDLAARVEEDGDDAPEIVVPAGARERGLDYDREVRAVAVGDEVRVGETALTAVGLPGHTSEMTGYRLGASEGTDVGSASVLFVGDTLFTESVARPDLEAGAEGAEDAALRLHRTLRERVLSLPDPTRIAPAHFSDASEQAADGSYTARLGDLRERLALLGLDEDAFVERVVADMPPRPANYEEIVETNLGRRATGEEEAFELELGPNNCAASAD